MTQQDSHMLPHPFEKGVKRYDSLPTNTEYCSDCDGDGICPVCKGVNLVIYDKEKERCRWCGGDGRCPVCMGSGLQTYGIEKAIQQKVYEKQLREAASLAECLEFYREIGRHLSPIQKDIEVGVLRFHLSLVEAPVHYNKDPDDCDTLVRLTIRVGLVTQETLLSREISFMSLVEWFWKEFYPARYEALQGIQTNESTAFALGRMLCETQIKQHKEEIGKLYGFVRAHSLEYALVFSIPAIILSYNQGVGEISLDMRDEELAERQQYPPKEGRYTKIGSWFFHFDMEQFCRNFRQQTLRIFDEWQKSEAHSITSSCFEKSVDKLLKHIQGIVMLEEDPSV